MDNCFTTESEIISYPKYSQDNQAINYHPNNYNNYLNVILPFVITVAGIINYNKLELLIERLNFLFRGK